MSPAQIKKIAAFYADPLHTWQEEYWGAAHKKLGRWEYRRAVELAIREAVGLGPQEERKEVIQARACQAG